MASNSAPVVDRIRIIPRPDDFLDRNVGASGEVFFDKQAKTLRLFDGNLAGGFEVVTKSTLKESIEETKTATVEYTVVIENQGEGNKYILNSVYKPELNFVVGYTYTFIQDDLTNVYYPNANGTINNQHPLNFSTDNLNGELGGGTSYLGGVVYKLDGVEVTQARYWAGFQAATARRVSIRVTNDTPSTLYYWCQLHLNMGNVITVADPGSSSGVSGGASVDVSDTPPLTPTAGSIWFNSTNGSLYVYVTDTDSSQWIQPTSPLPIVNTFSSVQITSDAINSIDAASRTDTLNFAAGTNITLAINPATNTITINSTGGGGGAAYDQSLNTTDAVEFTSVSSPSFINNGIGAAVIDSASTITLTAPDGISLENIFKQSELLSTITAATGVVAHDFSTNAVFNHTSIAANFTANITNVPTTSNRAINVVLLLNQGATAYVPSALQIDGVSQTINWIESIAPAGNINSIDVITFSLLRVGASWTVLGGYTNYGS
jgi:plastocyanin